MKGTFHVNRKKLLPTAEMSQTIARKFKMKRKGNCKRIFLPEGSCDLECTSCEGVGDWDPGIYETSGHLLESG